MYRWGYRSRNPLVVALIMFVIGIIFGIIALVFALNSQAFMAGVITTTGQITHCNYSSNHDDYIIGSACRPTVRYTTQSGQESTFTSSFSSSSYNPGDTVTVSYHPGHPNDARISDFISLWLLPIIFGGVSILLLLIGSGLIVIPLLVMRAMVKQR